MPQAGSLVGRKVLGGLSTEGDGLGAVEDDGAGLFQEPDVLVEGQAAGQPADAAAAQVVLLRLQRLASDND